MPYHKVQMHNPRGVTIDFLHQLKVRGTGAAKQKTTVQKEMYRPISVPSLWEVSSD